MEENSAEMTIIRKRPSLQKGCVWKKGYWGSPMFTRFISSNFWGVENPLLLQVLFIPSGLVHDWALRIQPPVRHTIRARYHVPQRLTKTTILSTSKCPVNIEKWRWSEIFWSNISAMMCGSCPVHLGSTTVLLQYQDVARQFDLPKTGPIFEVLQFMQRQEDLSLLVWRIGSNCHRDANPDTCQGSCNKFPDNQVASPLENGNATHARQRTEKKWMDPWHGKKL